VRFPLLIACVLTAAAAGGCHKKTAPGPVGPAQPHTTGSGDRAHDDAAADKGPIDTSPKVGRGTYGPIYFPYDGAELDERARTELSALGDWMAAHPALHVQIAGHTDERGTDEYNLSLGERRAGSAQAYLHRLGVPADRITTISYGEERPAVDGSDERSWNLNRRCELVLADR
jgi:peptidoglycan-associated lipoprotein